ncbi:MAG TPA: hypothetical protein VFU72_05385 [Nitrolancea sp.]|nr:hypothetical protein [Nitrolancea sp.]
MSATNDETLRRVSQPTYQNRLRVIGRQLDLGRFRAINLLEIGGGFLVRALTSSNRLAEALEFPHSEFRDSVARAIAARGEGERQHPAHPLLPTGYEDFLRALGYRLDEQHAEAIAVTELEGFIAVSGVAKRDRISQTSIAPFQTLLRADDIVALLDEAFRRRGAPVPEPKPRQGLARRFRP